MILPIVLYGSKTLRNKANDIDKEANFTELAARIFQHEYDHLQGKLFIDHLTSLRKRMINSKLKQIARRSI